MMGGLIKAELRKFRTTQVWFWMLLVCLGLTTAFTIGQIASTKHDYELPGNVRDILLSATGGFTYIPLFVLGVLSVTTEYRYQTITSTVLMTPSRWTIVTVKMITTAVIGIVYALICLIVELAIALPWLAARHTHVDLSSQAGTLGSAFVVLTLFALVGLGAGALIKNQIVAVSVGVIFVAFLDHIVLIIPGVKHIYPYLLSGATNAIVFSTTDDRTVNNVTLLSAGGGIVVLIVWGLVMAVLGAGITMNRDIT
jgi:ABC-2 type transport system permease protein